MSITTAQLRLLPILILIAALLAFPHCTSPMPQEPTGDAGTPDTTKRDTTPGEQKPPDQRCNGSEHLCTRTFDKVAYLTTHNAMSNAEEKWQIPNQHHTITKQLDNGVRGLMLDVHKHEDKAHLCHGPCALGKKPLVEGLKELNDWMVKHPREVVTIIFEMYVPAKEIAADFEASGLAKLVFTQPAGKPWPTLGDMLNNKRRLIVFTDRDGGAYPWYHDVWKYCWETHYSAKTTDDFSCDINRGNKDNALFIFNHFLTNPVALPKFADEANFNPLLKDRIAKCRKESGRFPNFITLDYYNVGDGKTVVDELNQK